MGSRQAHAARQALNEGEGVSVAWLPTPFLRRSDRAAEAPDHCDAHASVPTSLASRWEEARSASTGGEAPK